MDISLIQFVLAIAAVSYAFLILMRQWRRNVVVRRNACQPIVVTGRGGSEYDAELERSVKNGRFNADALEDFQSCGSSTFMRKSWDEQAIHTADPVNHQAILTDMDTWIKDPRSATRGFTGDNIVVQNGPSWRRSRQLVNPLFLRGALNDTHQFRLHVDRMIALIPRDGSAIDMQPLIRKLYIDNATDFIFGQSLDTLLDASSKSSEFIDVYDRATFGAGKRSRPTGILKQLQFALTKDEAWLADCKVVHEFVDECIARHRDTVQANLETRKRYVLIDGMVKAFPDPVELRFQLLSIFSLARETPAVLASNCLFLLARNPSIWTQLRKQALEVGKKVRMTFDQLMQLPLFHFTVLEALRLHAPITRQRRTATRDIVLPRGGGADGSSPAFVPRGSFVWIHKFPGSRDSKIWGDDVEAFRPSRFEGRSLGWEFTPFASGPRHCPANRQVVSQAIYLLYRLTLEFESIENMDPSLEFVEGVMMCVHCRNGSVVSLRPQQA